MSNVNFLNILPYIWISYFTNNNDISKQNKINSINNIKKFIKIRQFEKILRLDQETSFWTTKNEYISDIKNSIDVKNRENLLLVYEKYIRIINSNFLENKLTLIISPLNSELFIGLLIMFFKKKTELPINKIYISIVSKLEQDTNTNLSPNLKKILINK